MGSCPNMVTAQVMGALREAPSAAKGSPRCTGNANTPGCILSASSSTISQHTGCAFPLALLPLPFYKSPPHLRSHDTVGLSRRKTAEGGRIEFLHFVISMGRALQGNVHPDSLMPPGSSGGALSKYLSILLLPSPAPSFHIF